MSSNYNLIVIDLDSLVNCNRHVEDHGCESAIYRKSDISNCVMDYLAEIIDGIGSDETWFLVVPNITCIQRLPDFIEKYVDVNEETFSVNPLIKLNSLIKSGVIKLYGLDNKGSYFRKIVRNFINDCLKRKSNKSCKTIEARVECIIDRIGTPYTPRALYMIFCSEKDCTNFTTLHCIDSCSSKSNNISVLFIYLKTR